MELQIERLSSRRHRQRSRRCGWGSSSSCWRSLRRARLLTPSRASAIDFWGGFTHPIFGLDHVIAMVAVGLWGAFLGPPAIWVLPVVFPLVMAVAGALWRARPAAAWCRDRDRALGHHAGRDGRGRRETAAVGRCRAGRRIRDLSRLRPWRRTTGRGGRDRVFHGLRHRHRHAAPLRHRDSAPCRIGQPAGSPCASPASSSPSSASDI